MSAGLAAKTMKGEAMEAVDVSEALDWLGNLKRGRVLGLWMS